MSPARRFSTCFKIPARLRRAYAFTAEDFAALAKTYGQLGGLDRIATVLKTIRAERPDRTLFLDGGDTWQNSYTSLVSKGQDMVDCMALLKPDAMTGHWEFTLGAERVKAITEKLGFPFLAPEHPRHRMERGGVRADGDVRARRRQGRGDRPGVSLYADRQPALDDPELVVRHPRGGSAAPTSTRRGRRARSWWCCCRTTASTSTASSPRACAASTSSSPATPMMRCRRRSQSARPLLIASGSARQVRHRARSRCRRGRREGL